MEMQQIIEQAEKNIQQALTDYRAHTRQTEVLDDVSSDFIHRLAKDSSYAKQGLRELFSQSPVWDASIDALVINGTRTHNPDYNRIDALAHEILYSVMQQVDIEKYRDIENAIHLFSHKEPSEEELQESIEAIGRIAPKAYSSTKKPSRIFKAICVALGVADETAGSEFQKVYAQFADELSSKKISFKMYVSINPAHFITMSNPKYDERGNTLTSCHSFNSTEYSYNNGCSGYARDEVSFIVFTVSDPKEPETLNNRKTTRQVFAYRPGSGLLMQSRMYNTSGGVYGAAEDSKLYRDLVQREISMLEGVPNLWKTFSSYGDKSYYVREGNGFGGYADWTYDNFDGHISLRADCDVDGVEALSVGTWGLCVKCGCETSDGIYCDDCRDGDSNYCDHCEEYVHDELYSVRNARGEWIEVCENCRDEYYTYCDECGDYWPNDCTTYTGGRDVCSSCLEEYYEECAECNEYHRRDDMYRVYDSHGDEVYVCGDCIDNYFCCDKCNDYHPIDEATTLYKANGDSVLLCEDCIDDVEHTECPHCGEQIEVRADGTCPACGAVVENEEDAE